MGGDGIVLHYGAPAGVPAPETIVRYVIRTHESVILDDAAEQNLFSEDPHLGLRHPRSILCVPLIRQGTLGGLLYLENSLASHVFTPDRERLLKLLASQAAISLENTRLYGDLQEREARVRRLIDSNIVGIVIWGLEGEIIDANDAFLKMVGYDRNDLATGTMRWTELTPPDWLGPADERVADLKGGGSFQPYEKEYFRKDGSRVPVLVGGATFSGAGDQGFAFVIDLTDRKRAEAERARALEALSLRDLQLRLLVDSIAAPVALMTPTGEIDVVNSYVLDYFGKTQEELKHWATIDAVHPDDLPDAIAAWTAAVESGRPYEIESRHRRADGIYRWFQIRGFPIRDADGRVVRWCVLQTDIDDRKQAEAEARESERRYREIQMELAHVNRVATVGQLSASIAHEVNQPLSGVVTNASTFVRMLAANPPNIAGALETARRTIRDANRAADIIARLRTLFARKETPNELVNLNEASNEIISLSQREFQSGGVIVRAEFADNIAQVKGDKVQLQQVLLNLIRNGMDAMSTVDDRPRQLIVTTSAVEPGNVLIAVQDSGPGVDPENLERIFDAFYTTKPDGLGMGLSICRTIIEAHGGKLWAAAADPRGTILQFTLPPQRCER